jgi:hypothetical protein
MEGIGVERWFVVTVKSNLQVCFGGRLTAIAHMAVSIRSARGRRSEREGRREEVGCRSFIGRISRSEYACSLLRCCVIEDGYCFIGFGNAVIGWVA